MILTFYDLETSGLDKGSCDIHQLAYVQYNTNTRRIVRSNAFYLWEDNYQWSEGAFKVNGLSKEFLQSLPKEQMPAKYQEIFTVFNRSDVIGYNNINYDDVVLQNFMARHAQPISIDSQQDVRNMARSYFKGNAGHLSDLPARLNIPETLIHTWQKVFFGNQTQAHDATYDVAATFVCYDALNWRNNSGL